MKSAPLDPAAPLRFGPVPGAVSGWLGMVIAVVVLIVLPFGGFTRGEVPALVGALLFGTLVWVFLLRSRVVLHADELELRNFVRDRFIPYGLIEGVTVKTVTMVYAGSRRYIGAGVGRKVKAIVRSSVPQRNPDPDPGPGRLTNDSIPDYMRQRILDRGVTAVQGEGVVRTRWAWPELVALVVLVVGLVVSLLV